MSKSYTKTCDNCGKQIRLSDELGKWKAFNIEDNTIHDCKSKTNGNGNESKEAKKEITVEMVLKKLESIGIIINVDRLMNGQ
jgi:hypothetical protein